MDCFSMICQIVNCILFITFITFIYIISSHMYHLLNIYDYLQLFINKLIYGIYVLFILSLGAQLFVIQACKVNFILGILL